jgi:hypothetical protein
MIIATSMDIGSSLFRYYVIHFPRISSLDDVISNDMAFPSTTQVLGYLDATFPLRQSRRLDLEFHFLIYLFVFFFSAQKYSYYAIYLL